MEEDSNYIDFLQLNRQLYIINRFQMFKLSLTILGVSYFIGIFWYTICDLRRISKYVEFNRPDEVSFITQNFEIEGDHFTRSFDNQDRAIAIMYYALTTLSTVGFGDYHPENSYERLFCAFIMVFGNAIFGYIIGLFKQMIMENDKQTSD